ncbi:XRE family transcriptional regulator [Burkholderia sp. YIM B11467]
MSEDLSPPPADFEIIKKQLGIKSEKMTELFNLDHGRQWRRYISNDTNVRGEIGMHMLLFAIARLELDARTLKQALNSVRAADAEIDFEVTTPRDRKKVR